MDIYIATSNAYKVTEITDVVNLHAKDMRIYSASHVGGMPEVEETETTFEGNARLKAMALAPKVPLTGWTLGEDSGLCVDALGGAPGLYSARYAGKNATHAQNIAKLLDAMKDVPMAERSAYFYGCIVLYHPKMGEVVFSNFCRGTVLTEPKGQFRFGYNPLFVPSGYTQTFAELGPEVVHQMSHRANTTKRLIAWYEENRERIESQVLSLSI